MAGICSSRRRARRIAGQFAVANGTKSNRPAWRSDYHTDINLQMNYWPAEPANLSECVPAICHLVNSIREVRKAATKEALPYARVDDAGGKRHFRRFDWEWVQSGSAWWHAKRLGTLRLRWRQESTCARWPTR